MPKVIKIGLIIFTVLLLGFLALCVWGYRLVTGSLPVTRGELILSDLREDVRIYRDGFHIPHILAENEYDLFYTQGFVTAQDRFWQMDLLRRTANGQLSEIFGRRYMQTDSLMLSIGLKHVAQRIGSQLSPESKAVYQAYTDGINEYIQNHTKSLPIEFSFLNYKPSTWKIEDSIAILRLYGWQLNSGWLDDLTAGMIAEKVGMKRLAELFPDDIDRIPSTLPWKDLILTNLSSKAFQLPMQGLIYGSGHGFNGLIIGGSRTVTEKPLLANDLTFPLMTPSAWYEIHLVGGQFNVSGFSYPGIPYVMIGHNQYIAWGSTNFFADQSDLFIEKLAPGNSTIVNFEGSLESMQIIEDEIPQKFGPPLKMHIQKTRHGPIIMKMHTSTGETSYALSLRWTGHEISDEGRALYHLNRAASWEEFREALRHFKTPCLNMLFADRKGNIAIQTVGMIPLRERGKGFLPMMGSAPSTDWKGTLPYDHLPSIKNPEQGFITPALITDEFSPHRDEHFSLLNRTMQFISENQKISLMDLRKLQSDVHSVYSKEILALILPDLKNHVFEDSLEATLIENLSQWDGQMKSGSLEAALIEVFLTSFTENLMRDELGDSSFNNIIQFQSFTLKSVKHLLIDEQTTWFDDVTTPYVRETKEDLILSSYQEAVTILKERLGTDITRWT